MLITMVLEDPDVGTLSSHSIGIRSGVVHFTSEAGLDLTEHTNSNTRDLIRKIYNFVTDTLGPSKIN